MSRRRTMPSAGPTAQLRWTGRFGCVGTDTTDGTPAFAEIPVQQISASGDDQTDGTTAAVFAPVISGTPSIGGTMTISGTGAVTLYRDGVSVGTIANPYTYVAADIGPSLTVTTPGSVASNALQYATSALSNVTLEDDQTGQSGNPIGTWNNARGTGSFNNWSGSGTARPAQVTVNSLLMAQFDGINDLMIPAAAPSQLGNLLSTGDYHGFVVVRLDGNANGASTDIRIASGMLVSAGAHFGLGWHRTGGVDYVAACYADSAARQTADQAFTQAVFHLLEFKFVSSTHTLSLQLDAAAAQSIAGTAGFGATAENMQLGSNYNQTVFSPFTLGYLVCMTSIQSASQRADLRAFLTYKYGVAS